MKKIAIILAASAFGFFTQVAQAQTEVSVSRLYLINPNASDIKSSLDALEAAIKTRDIRPTKQVGLMPNEMPVKLGQLETQSLNLGFTSVKMLGCGASAYAEFGSASGTNNGLLGNTSDRTFGCLYLSKNAIRIAVVIEQSMATSGGLMGSLLGGIKSSIRGDDAEYSKKAFDSMIKVVREKVPDMLIELQELPGGEVTRPDDEKVKQILAAAVPVPTSIVAPAAAQSPQPTNTTAPSRVSVALEARKELTSLGLIYHSLDQFFDSISRKDVIVVELFLKAKAVDINAANKKGETAVGLAKKVGDKEIIRLIQQSSESGATST